MTPEKFSTLLTKKSAELKTFLQTKLPRYVGKLAVDFFQDNFRRGGWQDGGLKRWQPPKRWNEGNKAGNKYGPLLSRQNELMNSIDYRIEGNRIIISTNKVYAKIHNEGGHVNINIPITGQMRRFAWAKMYEAKRQGNEINANKWKALALTKKESVNVQFNMPQRQFMGNSSDLRKAIETTIQQHLKNILIN